MGDRGPIPPELKRRVIRAMIPVLALFLALNAAGFWLLLSDRTDLGIVCFLGATGVSGVSHLWVRRLPRPYGRG